jgi:hypothetical protein
MGRASASLNNANNDTLTRTGLTVRLFFIRCWGSHLEVIQTEFHQIIGTAMQQQLIEAIGES